MSMTWDDYARDEAISEIHGEAVMRRAAQEQCIYLFVEGDSEEIAVPILMTDVIDFEELGVKIANYNGHGNLRAALRLLNLTLSHDHPVIITHDNDPPSVESIVRCERQGLFTELTYVLPIPSKAVVEYPCGHHGGSFEEAFPLDLFLEVAFSGGFLPDSIVSENRRFENSFEPNRPWLRQLQRFSVELGFTGLSYKKTDIAESLAYECDELPPTFLELSELIQEVRKKHPVVHPDIVELPKIPGLTYFPKEGDAQS
jgi:hypothetical protein